MAAIAAYWARGAIALQRVSAGGASYYRNEAWSELRHGIFTRHGGVSQSCWNSLNLGASIGDNPEAVRENHRRMYNALDVNPGRAVSTWLVHSVAVKVVDARSKINGNLEQADAIITNQPDTPLVMRYADCVPLLLYDSVKGAIALAHAGWRGTVQGMAAATVRALESAFACRPEDLQALIGPAISRRNYQVGEAVAAQALAYFGAEAGVVTRDAAAGSAYLDLWRANRLDLERQGVHKIQVLDICTYDNTADFYSHRAENGKTGRFGVVISL
ncbi:MAG: peptidoglycan editing factor PgeF [Boseongicola sp. SB0673_bin_14]|nr:peptidoglycan editing factor PgeF [Chloroflexota bacterium]MYI69730.1 peptidoglycan editing factor PgeF [Boseongicola sp. SB0673_bin_14]